MAYSILDEYGDCAKIRLIVDRHADKPDAPPILMDWMPVDTKWVCDPCNPSSARYEVTYPSGVKQSFRWFDVVHLSDDELEVKLKLSHAMRVKQARIEADKAWKEFQRLNG
jgi:hypothetical protein